MHSKFLLNGAKTISFLYLSIDWINLKKIYPRVDFYPFWYLNFFNQKKS
ncbi:hypothetical protein SAMN06295967_114118 [Belliella buryatensis]|uniref:Uncharacterized protein n=1 Tax=Belliella buryatensis TaxID=1500549 RepID=A0A239G4U7_9BACT|nr:hypothetical protein SAMN06295967_114118 [Belliella buryatensis]